MADWTQGYITEIPYTYGYYRELAPVFLELATLAQGSRSPAANEAMTYCELGCGQGLTVNILAAANPHIEFYANDFNPGQIAAAQRLSREAGLENVHFYEDAFEEFGQHKELPDSFDIICLHGIFSWINDENRRSIVKFIQNKLKPGGLLYTSYNAMPGRASQIPLRYFLNSHARTKSGSLESRISQSMKFIEEFIGFGPDYFNQNPAAVDHLKGIYSKPLGYLSHEYFNQFWKSFFFEDIAEELTDAKLTFVAPAHLTDQIDSLHFTNEQSNMLNRETDVVRRQTLRDFMINEQFRRDIFIKGQEKYTGEDSRNTWRSQRFALMTKREDIKLAVTSRLGEVNLQEDIYGPILEGFANGPAKLEDILADQRVASLGWANLLQAVVLLCGLGHLHPCLSEKHEKKRQEFTRKLNTVLMNRAVSSSDIVFLASPVLGSGVSVGRIEQLFLRSRAAGKKDSAAWASETWSILKGQGQKLLKDGKAIDTDAGNLEELTRQATAFQNKRLPILSSLRIA